MDELIIRKEKESDHAEVAYLLKDAFEKSDLGFNNEDLLVERLRKSDSFIEDLSLVAEIDKKIVGFILFTKVKIVAVKNTVTSLSLAPVAVLTSYQKRGIGAELIKEGHKKAKELGYKSVVLLGHANYYPKFGYKLASKYAIRIPFDAPDENCMLIELKLGTLKGIKGVVEYPKAFYE